MEPTEFAGVVAWVAGADEEQGRAAALALAAQGARVLVTGRNERAVAECVGEIAHAGGKARHFVGDARTAAAATACRDAALARFGALHIAVLGEDDVAALEGSSALVLKLPRAASEAEAARDAVLLARRAR